MPVPDFTIFATPDGECFDRVLQSGEELRAGDLPGASRAWLLSRWLAEHPMPALGIDVAASPPAREGGA